jgi:single-stranded-DNA-specific exonuclease
MLKQIIRRQYQEKNAEVLVGMHPLLRRIYAARNIQKIEEVDCSLDKLLPYQSLLGINHTVNLLATAIVNNERMLIVGDFDADGATSTALAVRALRSFGAHHVHYLVPNRFAYGYGLTPELVEVAKDFSPHLIITVDNGIANHAGILAAKSKGIHVIVTDHHLPASTMPAADAIVNPNQPNDPFPSKHLAGVGVIFYVMLALRRHLVSIEWFQKNNLPEPNMSRLLDLVALGTVADLVSLDQNNRILIHQGLCRIRKAQCTPGIIALLTLAERDPARVVAADLGFAVGARLNAAGRMDDMSLGIECLLSDDLERAKDIARILNQLNDERKSVEQDMQIQALTALNKLNTELHEHLPRGLCLFDESWHQGVIGILASRLKEKFNRPVVVFAPGVEDELKGSVRSIPGLHIRDTLALIDAEHPNLIAKFGGHAMAAGLTICRNALASFTQIFSDIMGRLLTEQQLEHLLLTDGELNPDEFNLEVAAMLRDAGPWGQAFPEPIFDDTFQIIEQRIVGGKHLKLRLAKANKMMDAVSFFVDTKTWPNHRCQFVRAAYRLDINEYKGRRSVQLIVEHLEPA